MIVGGCVGSTAGGLKVRRIAVLGGLLRHHVRGSVRSPREANPLTFDGGRLASADVERTVAIAVAWVAATAVLWAITLLLSDLGPWTSLSASVSMLSNIGPNAVESGAFMGLGPGVKVCYSLAMVAGRLEILPFLLIFSRRAWR